MIPRYTRSDMAAIWTDHAKFEFWLQVELAACEIHANYGRIPQDALAHIRKTAQFDLKRIAEIENEVHHDVIAFLTSVAEIVGLESRYIHLGLTSSDVVDTAFSMQIQAAGQILLAQIDVFMGILKEKAHANATTIIMGRTHGVHAEPTTLGLKFTVWYSEMNRNRDRLVASLDQLRVGKISGAVGNYAHIDPKMEGEVLARLGLAAASISTQILQRDRHADFLSTMAIIAGTIEKIATEIRGLQKTETNEILEPFSSTQKGSSAMPHKRNPIISERLCGLARVVRGYALTALENQALWHERDISHSGAERVIFPDATIALNYMLAKISDLISGCEINYTAIQRNVSLSYGVFFSQRVLLALVESGISRETAYRWVQAAAQRAIADQRQFWDVIREMPEVKNQITEEQLAHAFSMDPFTHHVSEIFGRVYGPLHG